jgi:hypothetical protein
MLQIILLDEFYCFTLKVVYGILLYLLHKPLHIPMAYPGIFFTGGFNTRNLFWWGSTNSVEDRGQREWGAGGRSPLFRGSTQFANE